MSVRKEHPSARKMLVEKVISKSPFSDLPDNMSPLVPEIEINMDSILEKADLAIQDGKINEGLSLYTSSKA